MKISAILICFLFLFQYGMVAQTEFSLSPSQSMIMTGKGQGQDATINPYYGQDCVCIVENIGEGGFSIRIQEKGKVIKIIPISSGEIRRVLLLKGYELYLDTESEGKVRARINYEKTYEKKD